MMFLKREAAIPVIYFLITLIWTWLFDIGPINSMRLTRSIIEVFFLPWSLLTSISERYTDLMLGERFLRDPSVKTPLMFLMKCFQLVAMRYAELSPPSQLNHLQAHIFYQICAAPGGHQIPEDHPSKFAFRPLRHQI